MNNAGLDKTQRLFDLTTLGIIVTIFVVNCVASEHKQADFNECIAGSPAVTDQEVYDNYAHCRQLHGVEYIGTATAY